MAMADVEDGGLEFLSDPIDRFPLPDLAAVEASQPPCSPVARSSNSAVGDGALIGEEVCESGQKRISLQNSELPAHNRHEQATETANRFHLPDLTTSRSLLDREPIQTLVCTAAESSIGDVGDVPPAIQGDVNSTCNGITLSVPNSEQSTGKANPEAPGWTYTNIHMSTWL